MLSLGVPDRHLSGALKKRVSFCGCGAQKAPCVPGLETLGFSVQRWCLKSGTEETVHGGVWCEENGLLLSSGTLGFKVRRGRAGEGDYQAAEKTV